MMRRACISTSDAAFLSFGCTSTWAIDQSITDAVRKEGSSTFDTTQIIDQFVRRTVDAFEAEYGIMVDALCGGTADVIWSVEEEAEAGRFECDVFDGTTTVSALEHELFP